MANELDDFQPSRNFVSMFADAKKIKNIDQMEQVFKELCTEVGIVDPQSAASQAAAGTRCAAYMNSRQNNTSFEGSTPGKKV